MFEEMYAPLPDRDAYLARIGYEGPVEPTVEVLDALMYAHLTNVPFEDLDVRDRKIVPDLGVEALYDKIVTRHRGGYCYELNGAFTALLRACGFECDSIAARITFRKPMPNLMQHRGAVVTIDGQRHWADVGFGGPAPAASVPLDGSVKHTPTGDYRIVRDGRWHVLQLLKEGEWKGIITFEDNPVEEIDFIPLNFYTASNPTSRFAEVRMANLLTPTGSIGLEENVLRIRENGVLTERTFDPETELSGILKEYFDIEFEL